MTEQPRESGFNRRYLLLGAGLLLLAGLLRPAWLVRLSPDASLQADTLLSLAFLRIFLAGLGLAAPLWPALAERRRRGLLIALLLVVTIAPRLVRLNTAFLDQHAHRQTDNAQVARNYFERNPNIVWPEVNWYADRPNYIESTFPLIPWLTGQGYRLFGGEPPWIGRSLIILFAALGVVALFGLVGLYWGQAAGFLAALFLALSPLAIFMGRAFMDDIPSLALVTAGLCGIAAWSKRGRRAGLLLGVPALALGMMVKLPVIYSYLPLVMILWERWRWGALRRPLAWLIVGLPLLPVVGWYAWARHIGQHYLTFGIGGPASNEHQSKWSSPSAVLQLDFLRKMAGRVYRLVLNLPGVATLIAGLAATPFQGGAGWLVFGSWLLAVVLFTLASGAAQSIHNYYQLPFGIVLAPFIGLGVAALWRRKWPGQLAALGLILWFAGTSARALPQFYNEWQGSIPHETAVVQAITGPNDRVVTIVWDNDPALLFYLHRPGWIVNFLDPAAVAETPKWLGMDAKLLILQDIQRPEAQWLWSQPWLAGLELVERGEQYAIFRVPAAGN